MQDQLYWIWLTKVPGLGPIKIKRLLNYFGDAKGIWQADKEGLYNISGIGPQVSSKIMTAKEQFNSQQELQQLEKFQVKVVTLNDTCYPKLLKEIYDPPPVLYYKGDISSLLKPCIAIVGSRDCTSYGRQVANRLGHRLAQMGITIVSGLAYGIDTAGHKGALQTGTTAAVLGSGLDTIYPAENKELAQRIITQGSLVSSFPLGVAPEAHNFPVRNRIISGLAIGTIVVEAAQKSGSLITANLALEQGREVFAIPGDITRDQSVGTNDLIKTGAKLVQDIDDIIEELTLDTTSSSLEDYTEQPKFVNGDSATTCDLPTSLSAREKKVCQELSLTPQQFEAIVANLDLSSAELNSTLLELEVKDVVQQLPGRNFKLATDKV
ncbi:DNA-processing protein DprA [Halanaerobaculum tunisiense]